jgi:hypothetical protein
VLDLRLFQCVRDACRRLGYVCRFCDHGQIYCTRRCRDAQRAASRRRSKQRYGRSPKGRKATSRRMVRLRGSRKMVTDNGRQEVALSETVSEPAGMPVAMGGDALRGDARDRDGGPERNDLESAAVAVTPASASDGDAARGGGDVAGNEGPRCVECGRRGWGVRLEFLSRSVYRLRRSAVHARPRAPHSTM